MLMGNQVGLRAIEIDDLDVLLSWRNIPEFRKHFREHRELSMEQQLKWYHDTVLGDPNTRMFSIVSLDSNELIGAAGLCYIDWINRSADFSLYIGYKGLYIDTTYANDAGKILIRYGFEELNLHRIWSEIYDFDIAKIRLFDELGFTLDARHRHTHWTEGRWCDSLFYRLLNEQA